MEQRAHAQCINTIECKNPFRVGENWAEGVVKGWGDRDRGLQADGTARGLWRSWERVRLKI